MKKITAYVRADMAEKVLDALLEHGICGVSVFQGKRDDESCHRQTRLWRELSAFRITQDEVRFCRRR